MVKEHQADWDRQRDAAMKKYAIRFTPPDNKYAENFTEIEAPSMAEARTKFLSGEPSGTKIIAIQEEKWSR